MYIMCWPMYLGTVHANSSEQKETEMHAETLINIHVCTHVCTLYNWFIV